MTRGSNGKGGSTRLTPQLKTLLAHSWIGEQEARFVCDVTRQLKARAEQMRRGTDLASLTVHGALEPGNVLFDEEGEVVAWVDWADSAQFVRVFDVAHALLKFAGRRPDAVLPGHLAAVDERGELRHSLPAGSQAD